MKNIVFTNPNVHFHNGEFNLATDSGDKNLLELVKVDSNKYVVERVRNYPYVAPPVIGTFTSVWDTDNVSLGSSTWGDISLPLVSSGTYDFIVEWGDGTDDHITSWNQAEKLHTYASPGVYQIKIIGQCEGFAFQNSGDRQKLLEIVEFGSDFRFGNTGGYFYGCTLLEFHPNVDIPNLTGTVNGEFFFFGCSNFNSDISNWNVSGIENMNFMLGFTSAFNQSLSTWALNPNVILTNFYAFSGVNCTNYTDTLIGWANNPSTPNNRSLGASGRQYGTNGVAARNALIAKGWTISGDSAFAGTCP